MQLAHGRGMSAFGQPGHDGMMLGSPALSAGHPSPMSPFAMQQMQAQPGRQQGLLQLPPGPGAFGGGGGGFGQPDFGGAGGMPHPALMPPTPMSPQMGGGFGGPDPMQAQQAQALQQLHAMQQQHSPQQQQGHHPFAQGGSHLQYPGATNPLTGAMQGMPTPPHSGNSGAQRSNEPARVVVPCMDNETGRPSSPSLLLCIDLFLDSCIRNGSTTAQYGRSP